MLESKKYSFYKILSFNSISMLLKIIMGIVSTKLSSIYLGIHGINTLEFFRNFTSVSDSLSQFGLQNGIVKNSALSESVHQDRKVISTAFFLLLAITLLIAFVVFVFLDKIQLYLFGNTLYEKVILLYIFSLPIITIQTILLSYLQGKEFYKKVIFINCIGYLLNILLSFYLIINFQVVGAMFQIVIVPVILTFITLLFFENKKEIFFYLSPNYFDKTVLKNLLGFTSMSVVSTIITPLSFIAIRSLIQDNLGEHYSGIWSSVLRLSSFYMLFIVSICNLYFFPKLVKAVANNTGNIVVREYFKKFVPITILGFLICFLFKNLIIKLLYTDEFLVIKDYLNYQLIADFIKTLYLIFGYYLIAIQKIKMYIIFELLSVGIYVVFAKYSIDYFHLKGVYYALIVSFIIYLMLTFYMYKVKKS